MNETLLNDFEALRNQIKLYGEEFDVVLIAELFDESLIVLKDFLCWNVEDILFLKVGTRLKSKTVCHNKLKVTWDRFSNSYVGCLEMI